MNSSWLPAPREGLFFYVADPQGKEYILAIRHIVSVTQSDDPPHRHLITMTVGVPVELDEEDGRDLIRVLSAHSVDIDVYRTGEPT
jgi:hypothetical protein